MRRQDKHRAMCAVTDQTDTGPDMYRMVEPVSPFWDKHYPVMGRFLGTVNGGLQRPGLVCSSIRTLQIHGRRVIWPQRIERLRVTEGRRYQRQKQKTRCAHIAIIYNGQESSSTPAACDHSPEVISADRSTRSRWAPNSCCYQWGIRASSCPPRHRYAQPAHNGR